MTNNILSQFFNSRSDANEFLEASQQEKLELDFENWVDEQNKKQTMINFDKAKLIGEGEWVKNSAYRVYELDGKYYSVIVSNQLTNQIMNNSILEIKKEEIDKYI